MKKLAFIQLVPAEGAKLAAFLYEEEKEHGRLDLSMSQIEEQLSVPQTPENIHALEYGRHRLKMAEAPAGKFLVVDFLTEMHFCLGTENGWTSWCRRCAPGDSLTFETFQGALGFFQKFPSHWAIGKRLARIGADGKTVELLPLVLKTPSGERIRIAYDAKGRLVPDESVKGEAGRYLRKQKAASKSFRKSRQGNSKWHRAAAKWGEKLQRLIARQRVFEV